MKTFEEFCDPRSLYASWWRFRLGKRLRKDILAFERHLEDELLPLSADLASGRYAHDAYHRFYIRDPKYRMIHKAVVRDRVVHQALHDTLQPVFEKRFFFDSYSARPEKGTVRAIERLLTFIRRANRNGKQEAWVLHGDVDDFFGTIDHEILLTKLKRLIPEQNYFQLCDKIIRSFSCAPDRGLPLGNLTSQLFANVYLHELDYFVKQKLGIRFYIRYNDDFFIVADNRGELVSLVSMVRKFIVDELKLNLPQHKIKIQSLAQGIDVLGTVVFPWGVVPRSRLRKAVDRTTASVLRKGYTASGWRSTVSYLGLLGRTRSFFLREKLRLAYLP
ncbi:MAG: group II intron reverse transcriptase domain-containing protein [Candidatus Liptonbacteria bacterium]|nr:group II intron reverse transcriptase domain-containing protein [Candidatus Liptonbacteria bacterium]